MKLNTRQLQQKDLDTIRKWWEAWPDWVDPGEGFLPKTGLVVTSNDKLIMASFVYLTNADVALYEWIISDPDYREDDRQEAVELITNEAEKMVKSLGYKFLFSICRHKKLGETYKKLGWHKDEEPSFEFVKLIK